MRAIVLFLVLLVLSIPFSSTVVLASALGDPYRPAASGTFSRVVVSDNMNKKNPLVDRSIPNSNAIIQVELPITPVDPLQLTFANIAFQSCQEQSGKNLCVLSLPPSICSGNLNYQASNFQLDFIIDGTKPSLSSINAQSPTTVISQTTGRPISVISPKKIKLSYQSLTDNPDFAQGDCGSCSGVSSLRIFRGPPSLNKKIGEASFKRAIEDLLSGDPFSACMIPDGLLDIDLNLAVTGEEEVVLYAQACDALNHCSQNLVSTLVMVDNQAPQINSSFQNSAGQETYLYQQNIPFTIEAEMRDVSGIDSASLKLDIVQFNPLGEPLLETDTSSDPHLTTVRWKFVAQSSTPPTSYTITVTDKAGNVAAHTKNLNLGEDKESPKILELRTERVFEGISYMGKTTDGKADIIVDISDDRAGVAPDTVFFDLSQMGFGANDNPDSCSKTSNAKWQCRKSISVLSNEGTFNISVNANDLLGNAVSEKKSTTVVVDLTPPKNAKIIPTLEHPTPTDTNLFAYEVSATDNSPLEIFSTFSSISTGGNVTVRCGKGEPCRITPKNLRALVGEALVDIEVRDLAGNVASTQQQRVNLLQVQDCQQQAITISLGDANTAFNKRVASKVPVEIYFPVHIDGLNRNVQAGDLRIERCDALAGAFTVLTDPQSTYIVGPSKSALLFTKIKAKPGVGSDVEEIPLSCEISASVVLNGKKCAQPLIQNVTGTIHAVDAPIGDIGKSGRDVLDATQSRIDGLDRSIDRYEKRMKYLNLWCNIAETANNIQNAMSVLLSTVQVISCGLYAVPFAQGAAQTLYTGTCMPTQAATKIVDYVLWSKSYIPAGPKVIGVTSKYACMIRKCVLCNLDEVFNVGLGITTEVIARAGIEKKKSSGTITGRDDTGKEVTVEEGTGRSVDTPWWSTGTYEYSPIREGGKPEDIVYYVFHGDQTPGEQLAAKEAGEFSKKVWDLKQPGENDIFKISTARKAAELSAAAKGGDGWTWDPYRSIHYARACSCFNGIIFNMKKERDIYCMYKDCLNPRLGEG